MNFAKFLRTIFLRNTSIDYLLNWNTESSGSSMRSKQKKVKSNNNKIFPLSLEMNFTEKIVFESDANG